MFEKIKEARAEKKNRDVNELRDWQTTALKEIDKKFAGAEAITDAAEKILKLQDFIKTTQSVGLSDDYKQDDVVVERTKKKVHKITGIAAATGVAAVAVPVAIVAWPALLLAAPAALVIGAYTSLAGPMSENLVKENKGKQLIEQNPDLLDFEKALTTRAAHAKEVLAETESNCSLAEVSLSAYFQAAVDRSQTLRKRVADAATETAKQALEQKAAQQQPQPEPVAKKPKEQRSYKHLKNALK